MDRNQNFVALTMNSDRIVVVFVRGHSIKRVLCCWRELYVNVFSYTSWDHALF